MLNKQQRSRAKNNTILFIIINNYLLSIIIYHYISLYIIIYHSKTYMYVKCNKWAQGVSPLKLTDALEGRFGLFQAYVHSVRSSYNMPKMLYLR